MFISIHPYYKKRNHKLSSMNFASVRIPLNYRRSTVLDQRINVIYPIYDDLLTGKTRKMDLMLFLKARSLLLPDENAPSLIRSRNKDSLYQSFF